MPAKKTEKKSVSTSKKTLTKQKPSRTNQSSAKSPALRPTMLLVLGMHRSGTSVTSRLLECLGAVNSSNLMAKHADNPKGFFEDQDIYQFNESKLLPELGVTWQSIGFVDWTALSSKKRSKLALEALEILRKNYSLSNPLSVVKEPRIGILLPFWIPVLIHAGYNIKIVCSVRDPISVARSLGKRNGISISHSGALYLTYWLSILTHIQDLPVGFVQFDDTLENPTKCLGKIARKLEILLPENYQTRLHNFSASFVDESLRHSQIDSSDLFLESDLPPLTIELYQALLVATKAQNVKRTSRFIAKANKIVHPLQPVLDSYDKVYIESMRAKTLEAEVKSLLEDQAEASLTETTSNVMQQQIAQSEITRLNEELRITQQNAMAEVNRLDEELQRSHQKAKADITMLNQELQDTRQNYDAEIAQLNKELELSQNDISRLVTEVANQSEKYEHREEERYSIVRHRDREFKRLAEAQSHTEQQLNASNAQLQAADKDKQALTAQVNASNAQLQAADKDKQALTAQVNSLQVNVDQRFEELAKLSQHLTEIEDSRLSSKLRNAGKLLRPRKS
jgi:hypothetical protein